MKKETEKRADRAVLLAGLPFSAGAAVILVAAAIIGGSAARIAGCAVFGGTLMASYFASYFYHTIRDPRLHHTLRVIDHSAIFLLIAGTYTPFLLVTLRGPWGWSLLGVVWGLAGLGIYFKLFFTGRFPVVSIGMYLAMGWLVLVAIKPLRQALPAAGLWWLLAGGLIYTVGIIFFRFNRTRLFHMMWHLFVIGGSLCHVISVLFYVVPN